jgi:hypothetical protein
VIRQGQDGGADFDRLHSRWFEQEAIACAFDLLKLDGDDLRRRPLAERRHLHDGPFLRWPVPPTLATSVQRFGKRSWRSDPTDPELLQDGKRHSVPLCFVRKRGGSALLASRRVGPFGRAFHCILRTRA